MMWYSCSLLFAVLLCEQSVDAAVIEKRVTGGFQDPPREYRPKFRYWLPDASVAADIVAGDVASIAGVGAGGLEFLPFYLYGYPTGSYNSTTPTNWSTYGFGTPAFKSLFKSTLLAAKNSSLLLDFALGPNQGAGVPAVPGTAGLSYELLLGNASINGGKTFDGPVPAPQQPSAELLSGLGFQHPLEQFGSSNLSAVTAFKVKSTYFENATLAFLGETVPIPTVELDESSYLDLTPLVKDGHLKWTVPSGDFTWRIFSFWGHYTNQRSNTGGTLATTVIGNGSWTVDHFSKTGAKVSTDFWDQNILDDTEIASLLEIVGEYSWEDSMEILASLYWSPDFLGRFEKSRGYSLIKYLPLLFSYTNSWNAVLPPYSEQYHYGNYTADGTSVYNLDYRTTLNEGYQDFVSHYAEWSHSKGFKFSNQPAYNLPLTMLDDIPLTDAPECESLGFADIVDAYRQFSGPAHLSGRNVISNEMGAVRTPAYSLTIPELLFHVKRAMAGGVTMNVFHGSPYSGNYPNTTWPGYTTFSYAFTDMWNSIQPCWQHMKDMMDYVGRNFWILQQGVPKVDLAFYLFENPWVDLQQYPSTNLEERGYTYDYLGTASLLSPSAIVKDGVLSPSGPSYKALVFASDAFVIGGQENLITVDAVRAVIKFAKAGLPVIFVGLSPNQTLPAVAQQEVMLRSEMQQLLSMKNVYHAASINDLPTNLANIGISPRTSLSCSGGPVHSVWRSDVKTNTEYMFFYNDENVSATCQASFGASAKMAPYIYDAWTGIPQLVLHYTRSGSSIHVPITLQANQTMIMGLKEKGASVAPKCHIASVSSGVASLTSSNNKIFANVLSPASMLSTSGKKWSFTSSPPPATTLSTWNISIEDWHAPEDHFIVETAVTIHNFTSHALVPWTELSSESKTWGGVGRYTTSFIVPAASSNASGIGGRLHLGPVVHTMRASINGEQLPPIDPSDPVLDLADYIKAGQKYELMVEVTTPLFNRIKTDANQTMIWGTVAGKVQPLYASMPYQEYGLLGLVTVQWVDVYELKDEMC